MATAKVFQSGNSQAVRLPKQFRVKGTELEISRVTGGLFLREKKSDMARAFELLATLPEDFMAEGRKDDPPQPRKGL